MVGGQELLVRDICQNLDRRFFEVMVGHFNIDSINDFYAQVGVRCLDLGKPIRLTKLRDCGKTLITLAKLISVIRKERVEIVQTNGMNSHILGSVAAGLTRIKQIYIPGSLMKGGLLYRMYSVRFPILRLERFTDVYVALLPGVSRQLISHRVPVQKIREVIWGVDTDRFKPSSDIKVVRSELGIDGGDTVIALVSRMVADRGHEILIHAVRELIVDRGNLPITVLLVGDGPKRLEFEKKINALGLAQYFHFSGFREDIERIINAIDIGVLAPKDPIGSSFLREAMACGKPIITTDGKSGAQRDWIEHHYNGLLIPPHNRIEHLRDALTYLIENPDIARKIGENARAYVEKHMTLRKSILELQQVFMNLSSQDTNSYHASPVARN
jgi:glycosyltransferase involved in cell wall biosynthesis